MELSETTTRRTGTVEFKQTEVGLFPMDWSLKPLGTMAEVRGRVGWKGYTKADLRNDGPITIGAKHINKNNKLDLSDPTYLSVEKFRESPEIMVQEGDVLIVQRGTIGSLVLIDRNVGDATINPSMLILRSHRVDPTYLYYQLISSTGQRQILLDTSSTGVPMITQKQVGAFLIPIPPTIEEQRAIATALSDVDGLLAGLGGPLGHKKGPEEGGEQELVAGKQRLPGFKGEWVVRRLGDVAEVISGATPRTNVPAYWNGNIPWCTPTDITGTDGKYISVTERSITKEGLEGCNTKLLPKGALLLCTRATIGEVKIAAAPICTNQGFKSLVCGPLANNEFLYYKLLTMKDAMVEKAIGSTFLELSRKDTVSLELTMPIVEEQTAIAEVLSDMDAELGALEARRAKTALLKQGMMQELLTGRVRLV